MEFDGTGGFLARYAHGDRVDQPLAMTRGGQNYYVQADHQGSVIRVTDAARGVVNSYSYDAYGQRLTATEGVEIAFGYTGREYDAESGLMYYRARVYDPALGRFLQADPLGFNAGDLNLYRYVANNPVNVIDPSGKDGVFLKLFEFEAALGAGGELSIGVFVADEGGPDIFCGFDFGIFAGGGISSGLALSVGAQVGAFKGSAEDFASTTLEFNIGVPLGALPIGVDIDIAKGELPDSPDDIGVTSAAIGVGLGAGITGSGNVTFTLGASGVNGP